VKFSLEEIFEQSLEDDYAISLDGEGYLSRLVYGIKIVKDIESKRIEMLNTMSGGDYYKPLTLDELNLFREKGWRSGVYVLALSNYRTKLLMIEQRIQKHMNGNKSSKQISLLKSQRTRVMNQYSEINKKFNQLKSNNYGDKNAN